MANKIVADQPDQSSGTDAGATAPSALLQARDRAIYYAAAETSSLAAVLRREMGSDDFDFIANNALIRIETLSTAVCLLQGKEKEADIVDNYEIVFGEKLEVSHG